MRVSVIVAVSDNGVIGRDGALPWRLSSDLRRFKTLTMGHHMVMGRRTWDSVGRPLPGRTTIVVTRSLALDLPDGVLRADSLRGAIELARGDDEVFITGGAGVYREAMRVADRLYLTRVHAEVAGDTHFEPDLEGWTLRSADHVPAGDRDEHPHTFEVWEREARPQDRSTRETRRETSRPPTRDGRPTTENACGRARFAGRRMSRWQRFSELRLEVLSTTTFTRDGV